MALSPRDRELLEFEETWWKRPGPKAADIERRFGFSASAYYRRLSVLVDSPDALAHAPLLVRRLRRRRSTARRLRFEGAVAPTTRGR